ncbi:hypothetical protein AcW1_004327 [Taiwanofungus camphoratus]|nr:hypothetical protein AcW1_004327 [Antrodia cinnamomea]
MTVELEELDSYLYQTVGQDAIEFVSQALDVPLYRRIISGAAVEQGPEYGDRIHAENGGVLGDETEDLYALLSAVKKHHPGVQGLSIGAILSNYQRVRVEHVCRRLSLTPLCYLWQRDQAELLSEMIDSGMEAVIIKVAGIGLGLKHLGKTLAEMQPMLVKLNDLYGSHICGEGGEYETLTLNFPLFKHRIQLTEVETVIHSDNDFATVAYLRIKHATLQPKLEGSPPAPIVPPLLSEKFVELSNLISTSLPDKRSLTRSSLGMSWGMEPVATRPSEKQVGQWVSITIVPKTDWGHNISLEEEVRYCFQNLQDSLRKYSLSISNCTQIYVFLSSMDFFTRVNTIYAAFFGSGPPARACVAVDLPQPIRIKLDCIAYAERNPADRRALHVQGLSYWAPANIGPYSQAIVAAERIFISGQIGLIPSSLSLPSPSSLALEIALSFQHVERIVSALKDTPGSWKGYHQGTVYWLANTSILAHVRKACEWYEKDILSAPVLFATVSALPRNALLEKQVLMHTGRCLMSDEGEDILHPIMPTFSQGDLVGRLDARLHWEASVFEETTSASVILCFRSDDNSVFPQAKDIPQLSHIWSRALCIQLFYRPTRASSFAYYYREFFGDEDLAPVTFIPCRQVSTREFDDWDYAMFVKIA